MSVLEKVAGLFGTRFWSIMTALFLGAAGIFFGRGQWSWAIFTMANAAVSGTFWTRQAIRDDLEQSNPRDMAAALHWIHGYLLHSPGNHEIAIDRIRPILYEDDKGDT